MTKSFRTFLKHTAKDYYNQSVNPPVVRASTIIFKTMNELRKTQAKGKKNPMYFVNPEIIEKSKNNSTYEEGCLSVPGQFAEIDRPEKCHVKYLDYNGNAKEIKAEGMLATCIQHEMDHLEGVLFIDYLSKLKKSVIMKKLSKQKKAIERIIV